MTVERTHTVVVGGGQAGIAMSEHLSLQGIPHIVFERARIAERWRSERWDSLVANGPAWHDRFPSLAFDDVDPDGFATKERVARYFEDYAEFIHAPVRCGVNVQSVTKLTGRPGFLVRTSEGEIEAMSVVAATGAFQVPVIPKLIPESSSIRQIHSSGYKNPLQLQTGAVLVVGAGSSGVQIAEELARAGRRVYLSVGPHERPPRAYRGMDFCWWLGILGKWDLDTPPRGAEHVTIAVSGARGGHTVDFRRLGAQGIKLVGLTQSYKDGVVTFASDLAANVARGDASYLFLLDEADAYVDRNGLDLPLDPAARTFDPEPDCLTDPILTLDVAAEGVTAIVWATGYTNDYGWLGLDIFDDAKRPRHVRGVSPEAGIYFLGLPWQSRRGSSFIWGVWHDAQHIADRIATRRKYIEFQSSRTASNQ